MIDALIKKGHRVISVQKRLETKPYPGVEYSDDLPEADLLFCEWRWVTYKGRSSDIDRQDQLLSHYHGNVPIIMFDAAFQITADDEIRWPKAVIADPSIEPRYLARKRERLFFWSDFRTFMPTKDPADLFNYGYVGNDYDRPNVFQKFYVDPAGLLRRKGIQTVIYGNWIDRSSARPDPGHLIKATSNVLFAGRHSFHESMRHLNGMVATTHLCKPEYDLQGNITVRFTESFATGTPGLVPTDFRDPDILGQQWKVSSIDDVVSKICRLKSMTLEQRQEVMSEQQQSLTSKYNVHVDQAVQFIESHIGR